MLPADSLLLRLSQAVFFFSGSAMAGEQQKIIFDSASIQQVIDQVSKKQQKLTFRLISVVLRKLRIIKIRPISNPLAMGVSDSNIRW